MLRLAGLAYGVSLDVCISQRPITRSLSIAERGNGSPIHGSPFPGRLVFNMATTVHYSAVRSTQIASLDDENSRARDPPVDDYY